MRGKIKIEASHHYMNTLYITVSVEDKFIDAKQFIGDGDGETLSIADGYKEGQRMLEQAGFSTGLMLHGLSTDGSFFLDVEERPAGLSTDQVRSALEGMGIEVPQGGSVLVEFDGAGVRTYPNGTFFNPDEDSVTTHYWE